VAIVKKRTAAQIEIEQSLYPEWRMPMINFHCRKDSMDWSICSMAKGLLPENHSGTELL
jgi:hypothetical protein